MKKLRLFDSTILLTSELLAKSDGLSADEISEFICDGVLKVSIENLGTETARIISIIKMRNTKHRLDNLPLLFLDSGIQVKDLEV